jgi:hypothetical protein
MTCFDVIVYHNPCSDGLASAWAAKRYNTEATLVTCLAGKVSTLDFTMFTGKRVLFTDICPSHADIEEMKGIASWITILDHHKGSLEMYKEHYDSNVTSCFATVHGNVEFEFDMSRAGCQITWDYFQNGVHTRPWFLNYIADRDLWTWLLKDSREINSGLFELGYLKLDKMDILEDMDESGIRIIADKGAAILKLFNDDVNKTCNDAIECFTIVDKVTYKLWLINTTNKYKSEVGNLLSRRAFDDGTMPDFTAIWNKDPNSDNYWISMRNSSDLDLNELSKKYDDSGGGHVHAAGFTIVGKTLEEVFVPVK